MWQIAVLVFSCLVLQTGGIEFYRPPQHMPSPRLTPHFSSTPLLTPGINIRNKTGYIPVPKGTNSKKSIGDVARMPGTNWCGKGFRADGFASLGSYSSTDRCCRQHDLGCPESINPGETKYGLQNTKFYAVMHCTCDERFRSCLGMSRTRAADIVGNMFFNVIQIPCFIFTRKQVCTKRTWWGRCTEKSQQKTAIWRQSIPYSRVHK